MSDEKKITNNKDLFLAEFEAFRTGEEHGDSCITSTGSQVMEDLDRISKLFSDAKPDADEIPESVDNNILGHIKEKSREIRRDQKVVRLFPRYRWAAAAAIGVLVCVVSFKLVYKIDNPEDHSFKYKTTPTLAEISNDTNEKKKNTVRNEQAVKPRLVNVTSMQEKTGLKKVVAKSPVYIVTDEKLKTTPVKSAEDIDGNGSINIIDAYVMDRRLMSGVAMPKILDLNKDGNIDREDINTIVKTAVSLGKGEV